MATSAGLAALPTPDHITLLLKRHKSTVLLSVLPDQSFGDIKDLLLAALKSRNLTTLPGSDLDLPQDADQFELGILKDKKDPSKGWVSLESKIAEAGVDPKGVKRKSVAGKATSLDTPGGVGLVDGGLVAYRLKSEHREQADADTDDMTDVLDDPGWDVVLPSYEDDVEEDA